jgi:5-(carboxyamino)imidazole ribonucleotide mutase
MAEIRVGMIMGSKSDEEVMQKGAAVLDELGIGYEVVISSAHRNPERTASWVSEAKGRGIQVIIAGAGLAAALPGVVDALYSIVQMPPGVPVATVGIDNTKNAAMLAAQIIALSDGEVARTIEVYRQQWNQ